MIIHTHRNKIGDYLIKRKFALFPAELDEERKAWLQYVYCVSKVQHGGSYSVVKYFLLKTEAEKFVKDKAERKSETSYRKY